MSPSDTITARPVPAPPSDVAAPAALAVGTRVEVRNRFDDRWARGFEVVAATADHYRLRRLSDGCELPVVFTHADVRRERVAVWR